MSDDSGEESEGEPPPGIPGYSGGRGAGSNGQGGNGLVDSVARRSESDDRGEGAGERDGERSSIDLYQVADTSLEGCLLSKVLASGSRETLYGPDSFWKYVSPFSSKMTINGAVETSIKSTQWNIGVRNYGCCGVPRSVPDVEEFEAGFIVPSAIQQEIGYIASRQPALPKTIDYMDLASVVERLSSGLAFFSINGQLTCADLRGGGQPAVRSIRAASGNIAVGPSTVFVSSSNASFRAPGAMAAIVNAVTGEGGTAYTDLLNLDGNGCVMSPDCAGVVLAEGCRAVLNELGYLYEASDAGPTFALAVCTGIHKILSVAGHSDEGAVTRAVFRRGRFPTPTGAIIFSERGSEYCGLPVPMPSLEGYRHLVHSIALSSAGLSAVSDPMVKIGERRYPTILTQISGPTDDPGSPGIPATVATALAQQRAFAGAAIAWADIYTANLAILFNITGDCRVASGVLSGKAADMANSPDRHMQENVIVAFTWVEPTGVVPLNEPRGPAYANGCGHLAIAGRRSVMPALRDFKIIAQSGSNIVVDVGIGQLRRHGMMLHLHENKLDGLGNISLIRGVPANYANVGGQGDLGTLMLNGVTLSQLVWGRTHSQLLANGEFVDTNGMSRLLISSVTNPQCYWEQEPTHAPTSEELAGDVSVTVGTPHPVEAGPLYVVPNAMVRARSSAAKALSMAVTSRGSRSTYFADCMAAMPMLTDPGSTGSTLPGEEFLNSSNFVSNLNIGGMRHEQSRDPSTSTGRASYVVAGIAPIIIDNSADRGRRAIRPNAPGAGGGGGAGRGGGGGGNPPGPGGRPGPTGGP